jgi:hypothetical protein
MSRLRHSGILLLGLNFGVLAVCGKQETLTSPAEQPPVALDLSNAPATSGPFIVRFESEGFLGEIFFGVDPVRELVSVNGLGTIDPAESALCGGGAPLDILSFQEIATPSGAVVRAVQGRDITQHIYDLNEGGNWFDVFFQQGPCAALTLPRLAQGRGNFRLHDNDVQVSGERANAFGWRAEGALQDLANGGKVHYTETQTAVQLRNGNFRFLVESILLNSH